MPAALSLLARLSAFFAATPAGFFTAMAAGFFAGVAAGVDGLRTPAAGLAGTVARLAWVAPGLTAVGLESGTTF